MSKKLLEWSVDTPAFTEELVKGNPGGEALRIPMIIFRQLMLEVAKRAIELDDPKLHVLMLRLNMYELTPEQRVSEIIRYSK